MTPKACPSSECEATSVPCKGRLWTSSTTATSRLDAANPYLILAVLAWLTEDRPVHGESLAP